MFANLNLGNVRTSHLDVNKSGTMKLTADDSTGTGAGWNVSVLPVRFVYTGTNGGTDIPANRFNLDKAWAPAATAGQTADRDQRPDGAGREPARYAGQARKVTTANANFGQGTYGQDLDVTLTVPADSRVGTYTSTITVNVVAGP